VHKSLVVADTRGSAARGGQTRYRLLETIRQFAAEKLSVQGEAEAIHERLATYLISLGRAADEHDTTDSRDQMEAELGNIRTAIAWARTRDDGGEVALRLVTSLNQLWVSRGHLIEPLGWLEEALARGGQVPPELRLQALTMHLRLLYFCGYDLARWAGYLEELLNLAEQIEDSLAKFECLVYAHAIAWFQSDLSRAFVLAERSLALAQRLGYTHGIAVALMLLGDVRLRQGDRAGAIRLYRQALQPVQEQEVSDVTMLLDELAQADRRDALALCEQAVARWRTKDDAESLAAILQEYAQLLTRQGDYAQAEACLNECLALWRVLDVQGSIRGGIAPVLLNLGLVACLQGDYARAHGLCDQSLELYRQTGQPGPIAYLYLLVGYTMLAQGDLAGAQVAFTRALNLYHELGRRDNLAQTMAVMGALARARGQHERAAQLYSAAAAALPPPPNIDVDLVIYEREMAVAQSRYCTTESAHFWAEGTRMTLDQAIVYALAEC
jgi:tetratricopeptide (TPR) repeat protein